MKKQVLLALLLLLALPVQASQLIHGPESFPVDRNTPYSVIVGAQQYEAMILSFSYDSTALDLPSSIQNDTFEYGVSINGIESILGTVKGLTGATAAEIATISLAIPSAANESEFTIFLRVSANTDSDVVRITDLQVTGELAWDGVLNTPETVFEKPKGLVTICHFDDATEQFYQETVNIASIIKGKGHGQHGDDIIPLFWYTETRGGDAGLYGGNDWNKTSKALYLAGCLELP